MCLSEASLTPFTSWPLVASVFLQMTWLHSSLWLKGMLMCRCYIFLRCSVDGHLGRLHDSAVVNSWELLMCTYLCERSTTSLWGSHPRMIWRGHMIDIFKFFFFLRTLRLVSIVAVLVWIPSRSAWWLPFAHILISISFFPITTINSDLSND